MHNHLIIFYNRRVFEQKIIYPNIKLAKKILKWKNKTTLKEGLNKTIIYFKNNIQI